MTDSMPASKRSKDSSLECSLSEGKFPSIQPLDMNFLPSKVFTCFSQEEFDALNKEFMRKGDQESAYLTENADATTHCGYDKDGKHLIAVCFGPGILKYNMPEVAEIVAHEVFHVIQCIDNHIAEKNPGIEYPAYLMGHLVRECMRGIIKLRKSK